jgi:hypothetical protein
MYQPGRKGALSTGKMEFRGSIRISLWEMRSAASLPTKRAAISKLIWLEGLAVIG